MFQVGDKIVHPMHGAGVIDSIVTKKVNGVVREYYILKLPVGGMLVMIPTSNSEEIGVRPVVDKDEADRLIASMPDIEVDMTQNWNRRYRENMMRIKSGDLLEVAKVVKGLMLRGCGPWTLHRGTEDAPLGKTDLDFRAGPLSKYQLRRCRGPHKYGAGVIGFFWRSPHV